VTYNLLQMYTTLSHIRKFGNIDICTVGETRYPKMISDMVAISNKIFSTCYYLSHEQHEIYKTRYSVKPRDYMTC